MQTLVLELEQINSTAFEMPDRINEAVQKEYKDEKTTSKPQRTMRTRSKH